jgi:hypothetical protein
MKLDLTISAVALFMSLLSASDSMHAGCKWYILSYALNTMSNRNDLHIYNWCMVCNCYITRCTKYYCVYTWRTYIMSLFKFWISIYKLLEVYVTRMVCIVVRVLLFCEQCIVCSNCKACYTGILEILLTLPYLAVCTHVIIYLRMKKYLWSLMKQAIKL